MAGFVIVGVLAAFGALCVLWVLFGCLLPRPGGCKLVYVCDGREEAVLRRYFWLRDLGLLRCPLVLIGSRLPEGRRQQIALKCRSVYFYTPEEWIEQEKNHIV